MPDLSDLPDLEARFNRRIAETFVNAKQVVPLPAVRHLPTLRADEGLRLARQTLANPVESLTFRELVEAQCEAFTVEYLALQSPFDALFTEDELAVARQRLGITPPEPDEPADVDPLALQAALRARLFAICDAAKAEFGYDPVHFRRLIVECGAVEATREVLARPGLAGALGEFVALGRRDLSIEALALEEPFTLLFSPWDRSLAKAHLEG